MRKINPETETLRRQKISQTLRDEWIKGEWKPWNKEMNKKLSDYWKLHDKPGRFYKGMIPWNKGMDYFAVKGEKNPRWNGGVSSTRSIIRGSKEMREWKRLVFKRDNWTCQVCRKRGGNLEIHHIKSFSNNPELRFNIDNGKVLCPKCHQDTDGYKGRKTHKNPAKTANSEKTTPCQQK